MSQSQAIPTRMPPVCPYCGQPALLVDSAIVYGRSYGLIWDCRPCDAYVGVHSNSPTHAPKGSLANRELREWRKKAHAAFDPLWQSGKMARSDAYALLCEQLHLSGSQCHIGKFSIELCRETVRIFGEEQP